MFKILLNYCPNFLQWICTLPIIGKRSLQIKPCIDSTYASGYVLLFTSKPLETVLYIPGLPFLTLTVTSWPTAALTWALPWSPKTSELLNSMVTSLSSYWTFWQQLAPTHTICLKLFYPLDSRTTPLSFILFLSLFSLCHTLNDGHTRFSSHYMWSLDYLAIPLLQPFCVMITLWTYFSSLFYVPTD